MIAQIRPYRDADEPQVLQLLRLNTPEYFASEEEQYMVHYLAHEREQYFVAEVDHTIVACGGINTHDEGRTGKISWDMVHPGFQGRGIGMQLLQHRIQLLRVQPGIVNIRVRTSQLAYRFYERAGFVLTEKVNDYWAPGFHLYSMELNS